MNDEPSAWQGVRKTTAMSLPEGWHRPPRGGCHQWWM